MKFYYWKQWLGVLLLAGVIWAVRTATSDHGRPRSEPWEDNLRRARDSSESIGVLLRRAPPRPPQNAPAPDLQSRRRIRQLEVALDDVNKQYQKLLEIALAATAAAQESRESGWHLTELLALLVAVVGTLSTVVLSWRKDIRAVRLGLRGAHDSP